MIQVSETTIWQALDGINDPEMPISLVDMGLIYDISVDPSGAVGIELTFTSIGCPGMDMILEDIRGAVGSIPGVTNVAVEVVWSPPWTKEKLSDRGRVLLKAVGLSV
ncbi:MAG: metal-sulfur cluster assembly factor [Gemmatimonadota bacterium]